MHGGGGKMGWDPNRTPAPDKLPVATLKQGESKTYGKYAIYERCSDSSNPDTTWGQEARDRNSGDRKQETESRGQESGDMTKGAGNGDKNRGT